ncbi:MAG TPA: proton-conducting transporter membrane subunit [Thermoanaerobaculia bacterium]|nr:proton-conducting transporter membrane subunit [Thermoanaerobaculia bacterium]
MTVVILLVLPLAAAAISGLPWWRAGLAATIASSVGAFALSIAIAGDVLRTGAVEAIPKWIAVDGLTALMLLLIAFVAAMSALFSWGYMSRTVHEPARMRIYFANFNLFVFSMLAVPVFVEPTLVWITVELTTVCSALLVSFENTHEALEAAWKYVVLSLMGAGVALLGFLVLFAAMQAAGGGDYTWDGLVAAAPRMHGVLLATAFALVLVGLGTKVGLAPMHTWLPDAHSQAPSPVCALLSGVETITVLYVILRLVPVLSGAHDSNVKTWTTVFGLLSAGVAAFLLLQVRDYKRMFAFSTVEHMGIILLAAGLGTASARYGALYQAMTHALTKSFCFFAAGVALLVVGTREIASVRGLIRTSPVAGATLLIGALAIAGAPPFGIFLSEFSIFRAGLAEGRYWTMGALVLFVVIAFFGILLQVNRMVFGEGSGDAPVAPIPRTCYAALACSGALVIAFGFYLPQPLDRLLRLGALALGR